MAHVVPLIRNPLFRFAFQTLHSFGVLKKGTHQGAFYGFQIKSNNNNNNKVVSQPSILAKLQSHMFWEFFHLLLIKLPRRNFFWTIKKKKTWKTKCLSLCTSWWGSLFSFEDQILASFEVQSPVWVPRPLNKTEVCIWSWSTTWDILPGGRRHDNQLTNFRTKKRKEKRKHRIIAKSHWHYKTVHMSSCHPADSVLGTSRPLLINAQPRWSPDIFFAKVSKHLGVCTACLCWVRAALQRTDVSL